MKFYFGLSYIALILAALSGGALMWDGSYYLYTLLDTQVPYVAMNRLIAVPLQWPAALVARLTQNVYLAGLAFGLVYAAIPMLALGLSWWMVGKSRPGLFVWAALGIGFGTLMLQLHFISEAIIAIQLFWPIVLALLAGSGWARQAVAAALALTLIFVHPIAVGLLALGSGLALVLGFLDRQRRRRNWVWAAGLAALAVATPYRFGASATTYVAQQMSPAGLQSSFSTSLTALPLLALGGVYLSAVVIFALPRLRPRLTAQAVWFGYGLELAGLVGVTLLFVVWASAPILWGKALPFQAWALFVSLPFMGLAALEAGLSRPGASGKLQFGWVPFAKPVGNIARRGAAALRVRFAAVGIAAAPAAGAPPDVTDDWPHRLRTVQAVSLAFALILGLQSLSWMDVSSRFKVIMAGNPSACIPVETVNRAIGTGSTPLGHWSVTAYSLLQQGKMPQKVVMMTTDCATVDFTQGLPVASWDLREWTQGWFDLRLLQQQLQAQR